MRVEVKAGTLAASAGAFLALAACNPVDEATNAAGAHGRYVGIGVTEAGPDWPYLANVAEPAEGNVATLADDQRLIIVTDTETGEVRQCGNRSGHCVAMNPWNRKAVVRDGTAVLPVIFDRAGMKADQAGLEGAGNVTEAETGK